MDLGGGEVGIGCVGQDHGGKHPRWKLANGTWQLVMIVAKMMEDAMVNSSCFVVSFECWSLSKWLVFHLLFLRKDGTNFGKSLTQIGAH